MRSKLNRWFFMPFVAMLVSLSACNKASDKKTVNTDSATKSLLGKGYALEIFGNANGDWYIDQEDINLVRQIIRGEKEKTDFSDANQDGVVDDADLAQIQKIIDNKPDILWMLDGNGKKVQIPLPVRRIGVEYHSNAELMNVLGVADRVVAVDAGAHALRDIYFPGRSEIANMGAMAPNPNFEKVLDLDLDVLFTFPADTETKASSLPQTRVVFLGLYWPNVIEPQSSKFMQGVIKAGYIVGKKERAYDYANWLLGLVDNIKQRTASLPQEKRPAVLMTSYNRYFQDGETKTASIYTSIDPLSQACMLAGCRPIAEKIPEWSGKGAVYGTTVGMEWIMEQDPEFIFAHSVRYTYGGQTREPSLGYDAEDSEAMENAAANMKKLPLLQNLKAVKNNHAYVTAGDFRNNAMGGILGASYLAKAMHPGLFADFDPVSIHQEFVSRWMGLNYDLSKKGVFIAPSPTAK
ncbi:MAG: ABC transporter substrate-binding protein [Brachymonas sp.]|nr:ABC transporter substrate-binding protein [Brachymonas sp.]